MSFGFTAVGSKAEVIAQCRTHDLDHGGDLAVATRNLIVEAISLTDGRNQTGSFTDSKWSLTKIVQVGDSGTDASPGPLYAGAAFANTWLNED